VVSQFDKDDVEAVGLVKFDFLGLRNLTIIELAVEYIKRLTRRAAGPDEPAFDDPAAYQILKEANTTAIFQVESDGMKKLLKKLAPTASKTSSPCWRCTVRARWAPAWWTTSSCARRASRRSTTSTPT
jgi:DNA polymerase III alpha subunit